MAQTTILSEGTSVATSSDIVLAAGDVVTVGIFTSSTSSTVDGYLSIMQDTPGQDAFIGVLNGLTRSVLLAGPGTFRVKRPLLGSAFGVFTEA